MFLDQARLVVKGGDGGRGVISFRREAHVPRGGPDGGDGGKGGDVVLRVDPQLGTLADFRFVHEVEAQPGRPGAGRKSSGRSGADRILGVPPGTLVIDRASGEMIADLPGLIEGASQGVGLGEEFLRHVERTRLLVHVVDASRPDPLADIVTIDRELERYGHGLAERPRIVALKKMDLPDARAATPALEAALARQGTETVA